MATAMTVKGSQCSVSGSTYEKRIADVCRQVKSPHLTAPFYTNVCLGGSGADIDVKLNWKTAHDIGVEAKRPTPDWMQMKLTKDAAGSWVGVKSPKIPEASKRVFEAIIGTQVLFGGKTAPFLQDDIKYEDWTAFKRLNPEFKDVYIDCSTDTISSLYREKGCQYIQISGKGLYHTGTDVCGFGVPYFSCEQRVRIRIKVHTRCTGRGFASLSITAAAQPVSLKALTASPFSLDTLEKLPLILTPVV